MSNRKPLLIILTMITAMTTTQSRAEEFREEQSRPSPVIGLDNANGLHSQWRSIGRLQVKVENQSSRCSAALIDSRDGNVDASGPAYILTSGHCVTRHSLNFASDLVAQGYVDFDYFVGNTANTERYALKRVVQATLRGADLALIELDSPLQSLLDKGIEPLSVQEGPPEVGEGYVLRTYSRISLDDQGQPLLPRWSWPFSLDTPLYRYKTVRTASACESPHHYSDALDASHALIDDPIGPEPGIHLLCIIGVTTRAQPPTIEMMDKPVVIAMELAAPGATRMPELKIEKTANGDYSVMPHYSSPSLWVYTFKSGNPDEVQCDDPQGYAPDFAKVIHLEASRLPLKLCSKVYEMSRQPSLPRTDLLSS